jgi:hypothetical protein
MKAERDTLKFDSGAIRKSVPLSLKGTSGVTFMYKCASTCPALSDFLRSSGSEIEEPFGRNSSGSGLENREYDHGNPFH